MRRSKPSLLEPIDEVSEVNLDEDVLQDSAEPSALTSEQPPRPQRQTRQTRSKSKDSRVSPAPGAHKNGGEADQVAPTESSLPPVQAADTITQLTNSPGTHEVSCLCDMLENAEEGLLVQCDSCNKWVHCKCYNLDEQAIGRDDYSFFCMTCLPRPVPTHVIPVTNTLANTSGNNSCTPPTDSSDAVLEAIIERLSALEAELATTKQCLEDQKVQHKMQYKVFQSQILSLEEQNSLLERKL